MDKFRGFGDPTNRRTIMRKIELTTVGHNGSSFNFAKKLFSVGVRLAIKDRTINELVLSAEWPGDCACGARIVYILAVSKAPPWLPSLHPPKNWSDIQIFRTSAIPFILLILKEQA